MHITVVRVLVTGVQGHRLRVVPQCMQGTGCMLVATHLAAAKRRPGRQKRALVGAACCVVLQMRADARVQW